jgi:hypothetical protein
MVAARLATIPLRPFGRRGLMITMRRALMITMRRALDLLRGCNPPGLDLDEDIQVLRRNECPGEDRRRG